MTGQGHVVAKPFTGKMPPVPKMTVRRALKIWREAYAKKEISRFFNDTTLLEANRLLIKERICLSCGKKMGQEDRYRWRCKTPRCPNQALVFSIMEGDSK